MNPGQLLDHFDRIGDAPDVIPRLRRFILSLAVRGKLVEQDVQDEPASELLNRTRMGKTRLIKKGVIRRVKELTPIDPSQMPVKLPSSWTWTLTETISQAIVDCPHSTPIFVPTGIACIDTNCFKAGALIPRKIRYVSETTYFERIRRIAPRAGDVIFAREGSVGPSVIVPDGLKCCLGQRVMLFRLMRSVLPAYFSLALSRIHRCRDCSLCTKESEQVT